MPIFISYSHQDSGFVDALAANLVRARHHVWMDRWELNVGDSLTSRIEESLTAASAILVILSKSSIDSDWCKRELTAGLVRELEEKQTIILPCIIDDCKIPLFLRDKLYADFRKNPDEAFSLVDRSLSRISNATSSRIENPEFHTDYSFDWKRSDDDQTEETWIIRWSFIDHSEKIPYVILSQCKLYPLKGEEKYIDCLDHGVEIEFIHRVLRELVKTIDKRPLTGKIEDNLTKYVAWTLHIDDSEEYLVVFDYRRMGIDPGMDTIVHLDNNLKMALAHMDTTKLQPTPK